jgi:hypothetical protein
MNVLLVWMVTMASFLVGCLIWVLIPHRRKS